MTQIEKIKTEIERLRKHYENSVQEFGREGYTSNVFAEQSRIKTCDQLLNFISSLQAEPVSKPIDFEKELYKAFGQVKDFTLGMRIAKWFYDMGKNSHEPVSEDLEEACELLAEKAKIHKAKTISPFFSPTDYKQGVIDGANWQKEQMMAKAVDGEVGFWNIRGLSVNMKLPSNFEEGDKVKLIIIKED